MRARTVAGADGRTWSVRRNIEWKTPATGDEFEHDVDGGRGAVLLILSALFLYWVVLILWTPTLVHIPWYLWLIAVAVLLFFPIRWILRRPWTLVAETSGGYDLPAEHWTGMVRGRGRAKEEMRVLVRSLRTRATPATPTAPCTPSTEPTMPELPEVEALAHHLRENAVYRPVARVDVAGMSVLKTATPPVSALRGRVVTGATRYGKFLAVEFSAAEFADRPDGAGGAEALHLVTHFSRAGWLRWHEQAAAAPPRPGRGPLALRVHLDTVGGPGFDLTEAGTQKRLSVYLVADPQEVPGIARLGPDAPALSRDELADLLAGRTERIKTLLTDQPTIAGIGNAYSDEILHTAKLSPYAVAGRLKPEQVDDLHAALRAVLTDAVDRSVGQAAATLKGEKRSGLRVHARTGLPCPVCGDTVREVSFADRSFQYCPGCQTGGRPLADRRLSRLVR